LDISNSKKVVIVFYNLGIANLYWRAFLMVGV